jgi:MoxR-like ATPase
VGELSDWTSDTRLVRAFLPPTDSRGIGQDSWPSTVPAARHLLRAGLELAPGITILVGENGSGKSTVVEMLAVLDDPRRFLRYLFSDEKDEE